MMEKKNIVIYKFWASWCGPCRMYEPIFKEVGEKLKDLAVFEEVNAEEDQDMVDYFNVRNLPTTIIYDKDNKKALDKKVGLLRASELKKWIEDTINQ